MILAYFSSAITVLGPATLALFFSSHLRSTLGSAIPILLALSLFTFCAISSLTFTLPVGPIVRLLVCLATTTAVCVGAGMLLGDASKDVVGFASRQTLLIAVGISALAISTDFWIDHLQGFNFEDRTSRFAAPFAGDHWRNTAIISSLIRGSEAVFLPNSTLVYQILWHHSSSVAIAALPDAPTLFEYELGASLFMGTLFYFFVAWSALTARPAPVWRSSTLVIIAVLISTDADFLNAVVSAFQHKELRISADASSQLYSPFRYFSIKLIGLTAPQHAAFFVFLLVFLRSFWAAVGLADAEQARSSIAAPMSLIAATGAMLFSAILSILIIPIVVIISLLLCPPRMRARTILLAGSAVVIGTAMHWMVLRIPIWDLFLRAHLAGGGSAAQGISILPFLRSPITYLEYAPTALVAMLGLSGLVVTLLLVAAIVSNRSIFFDPVVGALCVGTAFWNCVVVDTEIQRHFSMIAAVLAIFVISSHMPRMARPLSLSIVIFAAVIGVGLNSVLIRAYTDNARFMPLTSGWPDYFCMNNILRRKYPEIGVIVRTPVNFELPIATEAAASLVWSQVAFVHQRISASMASDLDWLNPRDWKTFAAQAANDGGEFREVVRRLGFDGVVWGPLEERDYGPVVRGLLLKPENFLEACGTVALYRLDWSKIGNRAFAKELHREHVVTNEMRPDTLLSGMPTADVHVARLILGTAPSLPNVAKGGRPVQSSAQTGAGAENAVDGKVDDKRFPIAMTENEFSPWWEIDLGESRTVEAIRVTTLADTALKQYELRDFYVLVSERPFSSRKLFEAGIQAGVGSYFVSGRLKGSALYRIDRRARFVRIQRTDQGHLLLAEVEIFAR